MELVGHCMNHRHCRLQINPHGNQCWSQNSCTTFCFFFFLNEGGKIQLCSKWSSCGSQDHSSKRCWTKLCRQIPFKHQLFRIVHDPIVWAQLEFYSLQRWGQGPDRKAGSSWRVQRHHLALEWKQNCHELCCTSLFSSRLPWAEFWPWFRDLSSVQATHKNVLHGCCYIIIQCCCPAFISQLFSKLSFTV